MRGLVDGDTESVVVEALWFWLVLECRPRERSLCTREESLALDVMAETVLALCPSSDAQIDLVQNNVFEVTGGLVAKRKDESELVPRDGHLLLYDWAVIIVLLAHVFGDEEVGLVVVLAVVRAVADEMCLGTFRNSWTRA